MRIERRVPPAAPASVRPAERRLLTPRAAGYSYREIQAMERRTYTWSTATSPEAAAGSANESARGARTDPPRL